MTQPDRRWRPARVVLASGDAASVVACLDRETSGEAELPLVVTSNLWTRVPEEIYRVAAQTRRVSPRSRITTYELGPVLAWHPNAAALRLARELAVGSVLVVADGPDQAWTEWVAAQGGVDCLGQPLIPTACRGLLDDISIAAELVRVDDERDDLAELLSPLLGTRMHSCASMETVRQVAMARIPDPRFIEAVAALMAPVLIEACATSGERLCGSF